MHSANANEQRAFFIALKFANYMSFTVFDIVSL